MEVPTCSEATLSDNSYYRVSNAAGMQQSSPWQRFQKTDWCREKFHLSSCPVCSRNENQFKRKICFSFNCNKIFVGFQKEFFQQQGREHRKPKKQTHKRHSLPSERTEPLPSKLRERTFPFSTTSGNNILIEAVLSLKSTLFYPEKLLINISQD